MVDLDVHQYPDLDIHTTHGIITHGLRLYIGLISMRVWMMGGFNPISFGSPSHIHARVDDGVYKGIRYVGNSSYPCACG